MPTYQYACKDPDCGHDFELVQSFSDPAVTDCPECGGTVRKVFGAVGVVFKGSGFYRTDSRAAAKSSESSGSGSSDGAKSSEKTGTNESSGTSSSPSKPAATGSGSSGKAAASA